MIERALNLERDGAELVPAILTADELESARAAADGYVMERAGARLFGDASVNRLAENTAAIGRQVRMRMGEGIRPVRALLFDKTAAMNWAVGWHQDRTIAVRAQREVPGFNHWSCKGGIAHVEPPFDLIQRMLTVRLHLDDCDEFNAPLLIAPGSHQLGRIPADQTASIAARLGTVSCHAGAGDLWIYSTAILHSSARAVEPRRRRVLQVDFANEDLPCSLEWLGIEQSISAEA